ncbi:hypothetical protein RhiirB3_431156 [Rhizophagus irregularis]|nr:hypothetical protein RhiirB3_431156 [Rhizophagus irregularis]
MTRLELHLRTWVTVLERICFSPIELRDKALSKFSEIHRKTTQIIKIGLDNNFRSNFSQFNQLSNNQADHTIINKRNYNIDFLLISFEIRYIVNSLHDDDGDLVSILNQEFYQYKESNDNCSILSMLTQIRKNIGFKYHVALSY